MAGIGKMVRAQLSGIDPYTDLVSFMCGHAWRMNYNSYLPTTPCGATHYVCGSDNAAVGIVNWNGSGGLAPKAGVLRIYWVEMLFQGGVGTVRMRLYNYTQATEICAIQSVDSAWVEERGNPYASHNVAEGDSIVLQARSGVVQGSCDNYTYFRGIVVGTFRDS